MGPLQSEFASAMESVPAGRPAQARKLKVQASMIWSQKLVDGALSPFDAPDAAGNWPLNELRWAVLRASLGVRTPHSGLSQTARVDLARFREAGIDGPLPIPLGQPIASFDCGVEAMNRLLREGRGSAGESLHGLETYVLTSGDAVVGFYCARPVAAIRAAAPEQPALPLRLISGLGVDLTWRGSGLGRHLISVLVHHAIVGPAEPRPLAVIGFAIDDYARRLFHHCATRPMGDVVHPDGVIMTLADMAAAANAEPA